MRVETQGAFRWYIDARGNRYPSVTTILGQIFRKAEWGWTSDEWDSSSERRFYLKRGQLVHDAVYLIASGQGIAPSSIDPIIAGHVTQFHDFVEKCAPEFIEAERYVISHRYRYAGRDDLKCRLGSGRRAPVTIIDVKSGAGDRLVGCQTAAYFSADVEMGEEPAEQRAALYLGKDKWFLKPLTKPTDMRHFLKAREAFESARELGCLDRWTNTELQTVERRA